eukprot:TRINITY_DN5455_c0_g3_i1.p4 TRINITY_DN5455_c0_g3~~TRINITY_DN5455_c0_g3_i1.p4  ORF type:complete len:136 (+),score=6.40 TRINITY_DN5455_c0_g3_i1:228-635(+)
MTFFRVFFPFFRLFKLAQDIFACFRNQRQYQSRQQGQIFLNPPFFQFFFLFWKTMVRIQYPIFIAFLCDFMYFVEKGELRCFIDLRAVNVTFIRGDSGFFNAPSPKFYFIFNGYGFLIGMVLFQLYFDGNLLIIF